MMNVENPLAYSFFLTDDIFLTDADRQALKVAVLPAETLQDIPETPKPGFQYLGANKKRYLVISHYPGHDFMADAHLAALEATLKRLGVEPDDIAIFNYAQYPDAEPKEVRAFFNPEKILILGSDTMPGGMRADHLNKPLSNGGLRTLLTFSFAEMMDNNDNKKIFWEAMKVF